jgi:hypothetical protein
VASDRSGSREPDALAHPSKDRRRVTTTDLVKVAGLLFVLIDHSALFFGPEGGWWRVPGRLAAPIFFFLIGFARTSQVPLGWLWLGAGLTAIDVLTSEEGLRGSHLNILFNFAAIRLALPLVESGVMPNPVRLAAFVGATLLLIQPVGLVLEYGAEGWLWALFGLAQRLKNDGGENRVGAVSPARRGLAIGTIAALTYWATERADLDLDVAKASALALLLLALLVALLAFRRRDVGWRPPEPLAAAMRFGGRRSLEIYAVTLATMQLYEHLRE